MRIFVLSFFFPPVSQVGYRRPLRFVEHFRRQGHEVTVFCVHPSTPGLGNYTGVDPALVRRIPEGVRVIRTPSIHGFKVLLALRDRLRGKGTQAPPPSAARPASPGAAGPAAPPPRKGALKRLVDWAMESFGVPDPYTGWILTTLPALLRENARGRADALYVTGPPWSPMLLGALAGRLLRIPVHLDFRDPWTLNTYWKGRGANRFLEARVLAAGRTVITNTASMERHFLAAFPALRGRIHTIYNGFDPGIRGEMERLRAARAGAPRTRFVVSHIGMLYPNRMPRSLAAALASVAAGWKGPRPIVFRFFGLVRDPAPLVDAFAAAGVSGSLELMGEVDTLTAKREEVASDVLLLLQSGTMDQIPAKVFEYAFAGSAILCVADAGSETAELLRRHGLGAVFHGGEGPEAFAAWLEASAAAEGGAPAAVPESFLEEFEGERLSARMLALLTAG